MLVSIITPCLNSARTIRQTVESVLNQTYKNIEYIIMDGGSTDGTLEIIKEYVPLFCGRMRYVSEKDKGIYDAMNKGIAMAAGDVIGIINSDDWYEADALNEAEKCFQDPCTEAVYGSLNLIYENGQIETLIPNDIEKIRYEMEMPHPTVFIRREIYEKYGAFDEAYQMAADYELMLRLYVNGVNFACSDAVLANFRMGGISERKGDVTSAETLMIARRYLPYAPLEKRKKYRDIISHRLKAFHFTKMIKNSPHALTGILTEKLGVSLDDGIAVFGAGNWGRKVCGILRQKDAMISFFTDNDSVKWGKGIDGIPVLPPDSLKSFKGVLLAAVNGCSAEILRQIGEAANAGLYCIAWEEIADEFAKKEFSFY